MIIIVYSLSQELIQRTTVLNKNALLASVGDTGSGKSYGLAGILKSADPTFGLHRIVYSLEEMMELLNSGELKSGQAILYDEIGVTQPSDAWYTASSKAFNFEFQTNRQDNFIVGFAAPDLTFINSKTRRLFHYILEPQSINTRTNIARFKLKRVIVNHITGESYYMFPRVLDGNKVVTVKIIEVHKPPASFWKPYEERKREWRKNLRKEILSELRTIKVKEAVAIKGFDAKAFVPEIKENLERFEKTTGNRTHLSLHAICTHFKVGRDFANRIKEAAEYELYPVKLTPSEPTTIT